MKCSASSGMSSCRSRSGGTKIGITLRRKYRSSRNRPRADLGRQVLVRRRDHPHVDLDARRAADRLDRLLLQHAQHLGLRLQAHVADLVEEDRAAVGDLELAAAIGDRAGERAAHVAEQLALDQLLRNRRAVDLDERRRRAGGSARGWSARRAPCRCRSRRKSARGRWSAPPSRPARAAAASRSSRPPSSACGRRARAARGSRLRAGAAAARCGRRAPSSRATAASRRSRRRRA